MKILKKILVIITAFTVAFSLSLFFVVDALAHDNMLQITYDDCVDSSDDMDEIWYVLVGDDDGDGYENVCRHLSDDVTTIKYYFEEIPANGAVMRTGIT